ncbi:MAG: hypothetical protein HZA16_03910 [Nitrospirae bacterium]|nr:hypothetical protein [Nitrospirota bacterium]
MHDNIWWQENFPLFYKPVNFFESFNPGAARPIRIKSLFGYSHFVSDQKYANDVRPMMILNEEALNKFSLPGLSKNKRTRIRKGLALNEVRRIDDIERVIKDIQKICISMSSRSHNGRPPEYYSEKYGEWKSFMIKEFSLPNREWWGVFHNGSLIAYRYAVLIDDTMHFRATKSRTDFLDKCPNDALMYAVLNYCKDNSECRQVSAGPWNASKYSINKFKEQFGFERVDFPAYAKYSPFIIFVKRLLSLKVSSMSLSKA